jgi:hypothetical protein
MYIRNVPDETADRVERLARSAGQSVNAFVLGELERIARRADNERLLSALPDLAISAEKIVVELDRGREGRSQRGLVPDEDPQTTA